MYGLMTKPPSSRLQTFKTFIQTSKAASFPCLLFPSEPPSEDSILGTPSPISRVYHKILRKISMIFSSARASRAGLQRSRSARWRLCARSALDSIRRPPGHGVCETCVKVFVKFKFVKFLQEKAPGGPPRALKWLRRPPARAGFVHFFDSSSPS